MPESSRTMEMLASALSVPPFSQEEKGEQTRGGCGVVIPWLISEWEKNAQKPQPAVPECRIVVLSLQFLASLSPTTLLLDASYGTVAAAPLADPARAPASVKDSYSSAPPSTYGSSRSILACVTSSSRFVEHAV